MNGNKSRALAISRELILEGHLPLAPQIYLPQIVDESTERGIALKLCLALVALSDEVRIYGEPTEGMRLEIAEARRLGIPVVDGQTGKALPDKREPPRRVSTRAGVVP